MQHKDFTHSANKLREGPQGKGKGADREARPSANATVIDQEPENGA